VLRDLRLLWYYYDINPVKFSGAENPFEKDLFHGVNLLLIIILVGLILYKMKRGWLMKKNLKQVFGLMVLTLVVLPASMMMFAGEAKAINPWGDPFDNQVGYQSFNDIKMGKKDPRTIAANVINIMLGMLGVIAIIIILAGGFKWMTAAGNDDKVGEAKKLLGAGVVGLLIVLSAYAVSIYILRSYLLATGSVEGTGDTIYQLENNIAQ